MQFDEHFGQLRNSNFQGRLRRGPLWCNAHTPVSRLPVHRLVCFATIPKDAAARAVGGCWLFTDCTWSAVWAYIAMLFRAVRVYAAHATNAVVFAWPLAACTYVNDL